MNWYIPNTDPYLLYAYQEAMRWALANPGTVGAIAGAWGILKIWAVKSKNVVDDKIVSLIGNGFRFIKGLFLPVKVKGNNSYYQPVVDTLGDPPKGE